MTIIDVHNHLSGLVNVYDDPDNPYGGPSGRRSTPISDDELRALGQTWIENQDKVGISQAFVFDWDADRITKFCGWFEDRFRGMVVVDPRQTRDAIRKLESCFASGLFVGVKLATVPSWSGDGRPYRFDDPRAFDFYEHCEGAGIPIVFHTGTVYTGSPESKRPTGNLVSYMRPLHLDEVARTFPKLQVVLAHAGRPLWQETLCLANLPNVWIDLTWSQLPLPLYEETFRHCLPGFGAQRLMFGSDSSPWRPDLFFELHSETVRLLKQYGSDESDIEAVLHGNAERLYLGAREQAAPA